MPTKPSRELVAGKVRTEFRTHASSVNQEHVDFLLQYGHVSLDEVREHVSP